MTFLCIQRRTGTFMRIYASSIQHLRHHPLKRLHLDVGHELTIINRMATINILASGIDLVAVVLAFRVNRDDIPKFVDGVRRWFGR
jgi:hypothetical protein